MTSRRQARCDNRLALTFEARANIPRMRSRLAKWRPEIISVLARFGPGGTREGRARGQGRGIATWKLNYVSCCEMSCQGPWLVTTTNCSLQYAETCPLLIPPVRLATELLPDFRHTSGLRFPKGTSRSPRTTFQDESKTIQGEKVCESTLS